MGFRFNKFIYKGGEFVGRCGWKMCCFEEWSGRKFQLGGWNFKLKAWLDLWMKILESFDFCGKFGLLRIIWYTIKAI